ncbi:MAG: polysaccharide biosynthesis tyrosine autokinase [Candidatus Acidiferrales bacterium]
MHELPRAPDRAGEADAASLRAYLRVVASRRWTILSALLVIFTVVLVFTMKEKPLYEARALVEIEQEDPNIATVQNLFQIENTSDDYLETQYKILQSDSLAREVIKKLHLDQLSDLNPGAAIPELRDGRHVWTLPVDAEHEQKVLQRFEERLNVTPIQRSRLVRVTFDANEPQLAANVVNTLTDSYIEQNFQIHWEATQRASAWLTGQIGELRTKLEKSEDALQQYAQANDLLYLENSTGGTENIVDERLRQLQDELTQAQADRYAKQSFFRLATGGDDRALPGVFDNKMTQDLTTQLADLERQQAALAPMFKPDYPQMKALQSEIDRTKQLLTQGRAQAVRHIANEYFAAVHREALMQAAFDGQQKEADLIAEKSVQYNILKRDAEINKQLYEGFLQRLKEAEVSAGLRSSNIRVVDSAVPPMSAVKPRVAMNLTLALLLGLGTGVALAFVQEHLDNTLKSPDDVEHFLGTPALATIPHSLTRHKNGHKRVLPAPTFTAQAVRDAETPETKSGNGRVLIDARLLVQSELCEAFRGLRTSVLLSSARRPARSLVFVSADAAEGKTTVCSNLAISLAQIGKRVLVIDADMRHPSIHRSFNLANKAGLANYLANGGAWREFVQPTRQRGLDCLVCGPEPANPSELLLPDRMQVLLCEAMMDYSFVLVDSPPLLGATDGRILATVVEGTVLVVKGGATPREVVQRTLVCLFDAGANLMGAVLNDFDSRTAGYHYRRRSRAREHSENDRYRASV